MSSRARFAVDVDEVMIEAMREVDALTPSVPPMAPLAVYKPGAVLPYTTTPDGMVIIAGFKPCSRERFSLYGINALDPL